MHFFTLMNSRTLLLSLRTTNNIPRVHLGEKVLLFLPVNKQLLILLLLSILQISLFGRGENEVSVGRSSFKPAFLSHKNTFQTCWNFLNNFHDIYINIKGLFSSKYQECKTKFKLWWPYCGTMTSIFVYLQYDILRIKLVRSEYES